jgi:hypothetical protein
MASSFLDVCRFNPTAGGTTDWTYSSAVTGYQSPAAANVVNGATYSYRAESNDLSQWEIGTGSYNTGTGVLARTAVLFNSSGTTAKINFSTTPQVAIVALAEDLICVRAVRKQVFTTSGTYTPDANLIAATIECVGGGGGGGGSIVSSAIGQYGGGGGGGGGYSRLYASAATIGASKAVTIGAAGSGGAAGANNGTAGGDTSVGTLCIGKGGSPGAYCGAGQFGAGALGGVAGTGDVTATGASGGTGFWTTLAYTSVGLSISGFGGGSPFGGGGIAVQNGAGSLGATAGGAATGYGGGGAGAYSQTQSTNTISAAGGNGSAGIVVITEYCSK